MLCSSYCFRYFIDISSKFDMEFILWCSIMMDCSCFFLITWKSMNDCSWIIILPSWRFCVGSFVLSLSVLTLFPNGYMSCFNHLQKLKLLTPISGLVKFVFDRSLSGKKNQFLSKSGSCCYLGIYLLQPGYILSANTCYLNRKASTFK